MTGINPLAGTFTLPSRYSQTTTNPMMGGFGSVQPVFDTYLGRTVLFKSMHDPSNDAQLLNEIQHLTKARSRHIVEIYDVVKDDFGRVAGIIIEQLTGTDYTNFHRNVLSNPDGYVLALYQIATALEDLHRVGIVHRDLKLENLRSSASGILKLFDFGISCASSGYHTSNNRGTWVYAAPELYMPGVAISPTVDVYAFGICAWALATSHFPAPLFERPPQTTMMAPSIGQILSGSIPDEVIRLVDACIDTNPARRPGAQQLSSGLRRYLTRGRHKALFTRSSDVFYELSEAKNNVGIKITNLGELKVIYDGLDFKITSVTGDVYVNNVAAVVGLALPEACVITFGDPSLSWNREWVTFSSSHPEVIL